MLGFKIENLLVPTINFYESNEPNYFPDMYQMTEQTSDFEKIINEMKENSKKKLILKSCSNPNCANPFPNSSNCKECSSCGAKYCENCIKKCHICENDACVFCSTFNYEHGDIEVCPNCAKNH